MLNRESFQIGNAHLSLIGPIMTTPNFSPLTDREHAWIRDQLGSVCYFIHTYSPADSRQPMSLAILDRAFARWLEADVLELTDVNATINVVGIRFGQFLVDLAGFDFAIIAERSPRTTAGH